jgi:2-desacetyl-2-hydroxyethyl bacteriochlorophyllide A dehydrogenase
MKAIQFTGAEKLEVRDIEIPKVPDGWVLIKVSHAGICGTDLNIYAGTHPRAKAPLTIGHEFSGSIEVPACGFQKGDRVTVYPLISCMKCPSCKDGNTHVCNSLGLYGIDMAGGMAEYVAVPSDTVFKLPDTVSDKCGAFVEPIAVAVHTLRETGFMSGDTALVFGCGAIGLCVALTLRKFGARQILLVETDEKRIKLAKELGFEVVNPLEEDVLKVVADKTDKNGFDRVYDCAGAVAVAKILLDVVRVRGQIVIVASYKKPTEMPLFKGMAKEVSIHFVRVYRKKDYEIAIELIESEPLFEKIITHVLPAEKAQEAFNLLLTQGTGAVKVMFEF